MNIATEIVEAFAAAGSPAKVGRKAGWLLDNTNHKAGDIETGRKARLEQLRLTRSANVVSTTASRIDSHIRRINAAR